MTVQDELYYYNLSRQSFGLPEYNTADTILICDAELKTVEGSVLRFLAAIRRAPGSAFGGLFRLRSQKVVAQDVLCRLKRWLQLQYGTTRQTT